MVSFVADLFCISKSETMYEQHHDSAEQHRPVAAFIVIVVHFNTQM